MKKIFSIALAICLATTAIAQINVRDDKNYKAPAKNVQSQNPVLPSQAYVSQVTFNKTACISKEEMQLMQKQIDENIAMLRKKNPATCQKTSMVHPLFIWPTQGKAGFTDYGYYTVQNLVDHDPTPSNNLLDYNCGDRTYDWASGNHAGTDIILWPYAWRRMDEQVMEVVAAAPGIIVNKVDGNFDRNCSNNGAGTWNAIHVQHNDGSVAWYLHFKTGSLTTKVVGDSVAVGEYLGTAGSSGSSDWPHLHFQVFDDNGGLIDPYDGSCNGYNAGDPWWQNQHAYNVPFVNRICTKGTEIDYYSCPNPEITYEKDTFNIGDSLWLWAYVRDLELNTTMQLNLYNPSMQNAINWSFTVPWATWPTSYVRWFYVVDAWWTQGWWKFEIVYGGNTFEHMFYMTQSAVGLAEQNNNNTIRISPNPSDKEFTVSGLTFNVGDEILITDALGKIVQQSRFTLPAANCKLQAANFPDGIYFVNVKTAEKSITKKLLIQH